MWRDGFNNPADYSDNQGFCGGASVSYLHLGPHTVVRYATGVTVLLQFFLILKRDTFSRTVWV